MVILINGIINSGKTTSAQLLAARLPKAAVVEIDEFFRFFNNETWYEVASLCVESAARAVDTISLHGFDVIVPYPFYVKDLDIFLNQLTTKDVRLITLCPDFSIIGSQRSKREDKKWEHDMIAWHMELGIHSISEGVTIDNTHLSPVETVDRIEKALQEKSSHIVR